MARAIERIEQDITAIKEASAVLKDDLIKAYDSYLCALGKAIRQQLIMAVYHICTQGYPENFLKISFTERQQLQQNLQKLAKQTQEQLLSCSQSSEQNQELLPENLLKWQEQLEKAIIQALHSLSRYTNRFLQQIEILPKNLPESLLEVASKAETAHEVMPGPPNLLNLLVEAENPSPDAEASPVTQLIAVNLRLAEIEFADSVLMGERTRLRHLLSRLNTLGREYKKKQRERTIAEAESAWRASWFED